MEIIEKEKIKKIQGIFNDVGCAQLSDSASSILESKNACLRLKGLTNITPNLKLCGPLFTINTKNDMLPCLQSLDMLPNGYVLLINNTETHSEALAGDIFVTDCLNAKASGLVVLGAVRDVDEISKMNLPVFTREINFMSARTTNLKSENVPEDICYDAHTISSNDWIFGDSDGIFIIKNEFVNSILYGCQLLESRENELKTKLREGNRLASLCGLNDFLKGKSKLKFNV